MDSGASSLLVGSASGKEGLKELVVKVLSEEWPLSAKKIHSKIGARGVSFTYQGVHKSLVGFLAEGVVSKDGRGYALSKPWLEAQGRWLSDTKKQYSGGSPPRLSSLLPNSSVMHNFRGVISVPYWVLDNIADSITPKDVVVEHWFFAWPAQMVSEEQHRQVKKFAECAGKFVLCRGNSPGDLHCLEYLAKAIGVKYIAGAQVAGDCDVIAFRDFVINIYWPSSHKQKMRKAFSSPSIASSMQEVYDYVFFGEGSQMQVPVVITRNAEMAKQIIRETLALFEKKKVKD